MTRGKKTQTPTNREEIIQKTMEDVMHDSMMPYSEHVILERALPRVEDGLKPVQRRILYTMHELGNTFEKPHRKCARIVGDCLGKYHPHGDSSVYDALARMAQPFVMRGLLVDGHGNFGSIDGDSPAAMRYTEARMTEMSMQMLKDIEKDTVDFHLNFDDTQQEPDLLPASFPNLLVNGANGIAVGLATNIPTHNLGEVIDGTIERIDHPNADVLELMKYIPAPDFPTGGIIAADEELYNAYKTGRGKLQVRAKVHFENGSAGRKLIVIDEVPYQVNKAALLERILHLSEEKRAIFAGVHDIRDESDRSGMRAVIEVKKDYDAENILKALYKYSDLQTTFGVNMVAIAGGKPLQLGLTGILDYYIEHRKKVVTRRTRYELAQAEARAHILEGLIIAVDNLDEVIALIRASKTPKEAKLRLIDRFDLSELQAQAILDMRLQRLTNLEVLALKKEYEELKKRIEALKSILSSEKKLLGVIKKELAEIRERFADERRTKIVPAFETIEIPKETPEAEEVCVLMTQGGFLKRMQPRLFDKALNGGDFTDLPETVVSCMSDDKILFFTNLGNCFGMDPAGIAESRPKERGIAPSGILEGLAKNEHVVAFMNAGEYAGDILLATKKGMIKRTQMKELNVRKRSFSCMTVKDGDEIICAVCPKEDREVLIITEQAMSICFKLDDVSVVGRTAAGVRAVSLSEGDSVSSLFLHDSEGEMLLCSDAGYMKRCLLFDFERQARGGKGVKCMTLLKNGSNGSKISGALMVKDAFDFDAVQKSGNRMRFNTEDISIENKNGKGQPYAVTVMGDTVVKLCRCL